MGDYKLLIKGKLVSGDETMTVINPATEATIVVTCLLSSDHSHLEYGLL